MNFFLILISNFIIVTAYAYPNFIGYSYTTCSVCHYNGFGNGPLTDYGRALFSQEIAARPFISTTISDESLAEKSGFIPGKELPFWIRPSLKYRGLWINSSPKSTNETFKYIEMQRDFNLVISADPESKYLFSITYGLLPEEKDYYSNGTAVRAITREHYFRYIATENMMIYFGLMDKVYGIRTSDHTSANRSAIGFGLNDQVHGLLIEYNQPNWTIGTHVFTGNLLQNENYRQKGFSTLFEYDFVEKNRIGFSTASFENSFNRYRRISFHDRIGLVGYHGCSLLFELGLKEDQNKLSDKSSLGAYSWIEATLFLARGYSIVSTIERIQNEIKPNSVDTQRWTFGLLSFPIQRTEFRLNYIHSKSFSSEAAFQDRDALQGQIHVSL